MKKKVAKKKISKKDTPEKERYFGVVLEDINSKFQAISEGYDVLNNKMDRFYSEFSDFKSETQNNFKITFDYLSRIDDELNDIKREIADLKNRLVQKADLERVLDLEKRVKHLESILAKQR